MRRAGGGAGGAVGGGGVIYNILIELRSCIRSLSASTSTSTSTSAFINDNCSTRHKFYAAGGNSLRFKLAAINYGTKKESQVKTKHCRLMCDHQ